MTGRVVEINALRGLVGVETVRGGCTVLALIGGAGEIIVRDELRWDGDTPIGVAEIWNVSQRNGLRVEFRQHYVVRALLRRQLEFGR